jgi:hypothetical protein
MNFLCDEFLKTHTEKYDVNVIFNETEMEMLQNFYTISDEDVLHLKKIVLKFMNDVLNINIELPRASLTDTSFKFHQINLLSSDNTKLLYSLVINTIKTSPAYGGVEIVFKGVDLEPTPVYTTVLFPIEINGDAFHIKDNILYKNDECTKIFYTESSQTIDKVKSEYIRLIPQFDKGNLRAILVLDDEYYADNFVIGYMDTEKNIIYSDGKSYSSEAFDFSDYTISDISLRETYANFYFAHYNVVMIYNTSYDLWKLMKCFAGNASNAITSLKDGFTKIVI